MNAAGEHGRSGLAIVGRDAELAVVEGFVDAVRAGPGALVIRGDPGIGKTTLWRCGIERARAAGATVLLARPAEDELSLDYGGLVDLFERTALPLGPDATADPFAVGRDVLARLRLLAEANTLVIAIDDLPWLDSRSARALRYALRRLEDEPIALLVTARTETQSGDRPPTTGFEPAREETVELAPFSIDEVRQLLEGIVTAISRPTLRRIHEVSGGNPLYACELARGLGGSAAVHLTDGSLTLPDSIRGAIARRIETVSPDVLALLEVLSALGSASIDELRALLPDRDLEACLATAEQLSLVVLDPAHAVRFGHPLIASVAYERMGRLERRDLHTRLAEGASDLDVRARHLALSSEGPDAGAASDLEAASARAGERCRYDVAAELARHSRRLTPEQDEDALLRRALLEIAATANAGELGRARGLADELVASLSPGRARAEAIFYRAHHETDDCFTAERYLSQALAEVGGDDTLRAWILEILSWQQALHRGDLAAGRASATQAVEIAVRTGDRALEMHSRGSRGHLANLAGTDGRAELERSYELWLEAGSGTMWAGPRPYMAEDRLWSGNLAEARLIVDTVLAELGQHGVESDRPYHLYDLVVLACAAGDFLEAESLATQAVRAARDADDEWASMILAYPLALVDAWRGRADACEGRARSRLIEADRRGEQPAAARLRTLLGVLSLSRADLAGAAAELSEAVAIFDRTGYGHHAAIPAVPEAIEALSRAGETERADALCVRLERDARRLSSSWVDAAAERARGHVLLAAGSPDEAARVFAHAAEAFGELGFRPDAARARLSRGQALIRAGHRSLAAEDLAHAHASFAQMGAVLWMERAAEELDRVSPGRAAGELTSTERQVARLVADGLRNREIGARLYMAIATVEAHLTRVYRKLGIRSRAELARLVAEDVAMVEAVPADREGSDDGRSIVT